MGYCFHKRTQRMAVITLFGHPQDLTRINTDDLAATLTATVIENELQLSKTPTQSPSLFNSNRTPARQSQSSAGLFNPTKLTPKPQPLQPALQVSDSRSDNVIPLNTIKPKG
jgi:hypothetical protein